MIILFSDKDIGILVNNVGVAYDQLKYFHQDSEANMWNMINVNIGAMTLMNKMILPKMEIKKKGAIINIASVAAMGPQAWIMPLTFEKICLKNETFIGKVSHKYCTDH